MGFTGDVLSGVEVIAPESMSPSLPHDPFVRVLREPVSIHDLELARVASHLRALAVALDVAGLVALARWVRRWAARKPVDPSQVDALERRLRWTGFLRWPTSGVGRLPADALRTGGLGPIGRAAGIPEDARTDIAAYRDLGFRPVTIDSGDAAARWRVRMAEVRQSLELAAASGGLTTGPVEAFEGPRGLVTADRRPIAAQLATLPVVLDGLEWGDALTTLVSLDLGPEAFSAPAVPTAAAA